MKKPTLFAIELTSRQWELLGPYSSWLLLPAPY